MEETKYIWMDGKLVPWKDAKIHILTHSLHYGSAVFEGIRLYKTSKGPAIFKLKEHIKRLFESGKAFNMKIPFTEKEINEAVIKTVKENKIQAGYIRPLVYFGYGKMGLGLKGAPVNVSIAVWPWGKYLGENAIKVKTSRFVRIHPQSSIMGAKISGHYTNSILASEDVLGQGYDEALLLDYKGNIAEGPGENLFIIKKGQLVTPKLGTILPGITRASIIQIAKDEGIKVQEKVLKLKDVYKADEAFFTGTAAEITFIDSLDDKKIGTNQKPISEKLRKIFMNVVEGKNYKYSNWLTIVK